MENTLEHFKEFLFFPDGGTFLPEGEWENRYRIVPHRLLGYINEEKIRKKMALTFESANEGTVVVQRKPESTGLKLEVKVCRRWGLWENVNITEQNIQAVIHCKNDLTTTPVRWEKTYNSRPFEYGEVRDHFIPLQKHVETGKLVGNQIQFSHGITESLMSDMLTSNFSVIDALQRNKLSKFDRLKADLLEDLSILRPEQQFVYMGEHQINIQGKMVKLSGIRLTGRATMPTTYWLDSDRRVRFIIGFQVALLFDPIFTPAEEQI